MPVKRAEKNLFYLPLDRVRLCVPVRGPFVRFRFPVLTYGPTNTMKYLKPVLLLLFLGTFCFSAGNKSKRKVVSFHIQGAETDGEKFVIPITMGSQRYYFRKIPVFTDEDVKWFYPFNSRDGKSFGVAFCLKNHAAMKLNDICRTHPGKLLAINVIGAPTQAVIIDRPPNDGIIVLWKGMTQDYLTLFRAKFPHMDDVLGTTSATDSGPQFNLPKKKSPFKFSKKGSQ